jgi:hypothetical protein
LGFQRKQHFRRRFLAPVFDLVDEARRHAKARGENLGSKSPPNLADAPPDCSAGE